MRILIVAATSLEIKPFLDLLGKLDGDENAVVNGHELQFLVTGVGMTATAYQLGIKLATNNYDLAINIGLAGAFKKEFSLGELVNVVIDQNIEEGAEDGNEFLSIWEMGLRGLNDFPFENGQLNAKIPQNIKLNYRKVRGITVNMVHGNESSIKEIQSLFNPDIESMEGASFFFACLFAGLSCLQLRSISNYVERRDRSKWEVELALNNLAKELKVLLEEIS